MEHSLVYSTVYHLTLRGWPDHIQDVPHIAQHIWSARDELSIDSVLLLKGQGYVYCQNCLTGHLLICMELIRELIGCRLRLENLCIGLA